jgi:hypothetical protein
MHFISNCSIYAVLNTKFYDIDVYIYSAGCVAKEEEGVGRINLPLDLHMIHGSVYTCR